MEWVSSLAAFPCFLNQQIGCNKIHKQSRPKVLCSSLLAFSDLRIFSRSASFWAPLLCNFIADDSNAVQACVAGMFELQDHAAFKDHLRDFLVQTKSFSSQDNADLFADEAEKARQVQCFLFTMPALATKNCPYTRLSLL